VALLSIADVTLGDAAPRLGNTGLMLSLTRCVTFWTFLSNSSFMTTTA